MLPVVTIYGAKELGFILRQSGAKWLFTPDRFRNVDYVRVVADCGPLSVLERHIVTGPAFDALEADGPIAEPAFRSAAEGWIPNTWHSFSVTIKIHETEGLVTLRRDGEPIINVTNINTVNGSHTTIEDRKSTRLNSSH